MATAAKKKSTAVATVKSKVPVSAELMASIKQDIEDQAAMVQPSTSNKIKFSKTQSHHYVFPDKSEVATFEGVVLDFATVQVLYDGPYVEGQINTIVCYASATKPVDLAPLPEVLTPQAVECKTCPKSKFSPDGTKPECGLRKVLAILPIDADASTDIILLDLPVLGAKAFDKYAQSVLVTEGLPIYGAITKFGFDETVKYDSPRFSMIETCDGELAAVARSRRDEARRILLAPPTITPVEPKAQKGGMKAPAKRRGA